MHVVHRGFLSLFVLAIGLCAWTGDARAQGSAVTDRMALEAVYRATGGENWTHRDNWLEDVPLREWYGVEVNGGGRVTRLRLGGWDDNVREHVGNGLTGALPPEVGTLSELRWLEIIGNRGLTGAIPPALGGLGNLERVGLDHNALIGPIPTELGNLTHLRSLTLSSNALSGRVPVELGNLTGLTSLNIGWTQLSGPLPASLIRLSGLEWLQLEGSGLCMPDSPTVRAWLGTIRDFTGAVCDESLTFLRVVTQPGLGRLDFVLAVADLDGDGHDDILAGGREDYYSGAPEERFDKTALRLFVSAGDGSFRHAPELVEGTLDARYPIVAADDFNRDGRADFAVFDAGVYVEEESGFNGNPPQLFLSSPGGRLRPSEALADAVRREHALRPQPRYSGPADLHVKSAASGDIDGDGDIDLWVESTGGANVNSHFMLNNGDGTFTLDPDRAPYELLHNRQPEFWRHVGNDLMDLDNDGDLDLALGQIRDFDPTHVNQFSIVLVNDGTGHYPQRIELPHPAFYDGYTSVQALSHFDVDGDGFQDLVLVHERNGDTHPDVLWSTGRYIQVLVNRGGRSFVDETPTRMGDQSATTPERDADGNPLWNIADPRMHDVDRDGCADLVMSRIRHGVRAESPLVYRNDGRGRFQAMSPMPFAGSDRYFGRYAVPADVNGDGATDFVVPHLHSPGPDERYDTADDVALLVTLLNTTPTGPARCRPRVTAVRTLPARTLYVGDGAVAVIVPVGAAFRNASTYRASSSAPGVATVSMSGSNLTVTPAAPGVAAITVTATGADSSVAIQRFRVTVLAATAFTDPLRSGTTPPRAIHFLELRTRIAALRAWQGLSSVQWTDRVLTIGVTPVRRIHLTELRDALDGAYDAARRSRPTYTDPIVTAGVTAVRAVHVVELRNAVVALE